MPAALPSIYFTQDAIEAKLAYFHLGMQKLRPCGVHRFPVCLGTRAIAKRGLSPAFVSGRIISRARACPRVYPPRNEHRRFSGAMSWREGKVRHFRFMEVTCSRSGGVLSTGRLEPLGGRLFQVDIDPDGKTEIYCDLYNPNDKAAN